MSGLTKKVVYADRLLAALLEVSEGELVSYAQISKGVHKYIKDKDLRNISAQRPQVTEQRPPLAESYVAQTTKRCRDCGAEIPYEAVFCDLCGVSQ